MPPAPMQVLNRLCLPRQPRIRETEKVAAMPAASRKPMAPVSVSHLQVVVVRVVEDQARVPGLIAPIALLEGAEAGAEEREILDDAEGVLEHVQPAHLILLLDVLEPLRDPVPGRQQDRSAERGRDQRQPERLPAQRSPAPGQPHEGEPRDGACRQGAAGKRREQARRHQQHEQGDPRRRARGSRSPGTARARRPSPRAATVSLRRREEQQAQPERYRHLQVAGEVVVVDVGAPDAEAGAQGLLDRVEPEDSPVPGQPLGDGQDGEEPSR